MQIKSLLPTPPIEKTGWPWTEIPDPLPHNMPDGSPWPRISIVTPSFNQAQYLEETIRSVLLQGYPNLEYIIIDGGSTDGSVEIIKRYEPWLTYWVSEPDRGQSHAINKGFKVSSGDIFNWLNSDDFLLPGALYKVSTKYMDHKSPFFIIAANALIKNEDGSYSQRLPIRKVSGWIEQIGVKWEGGIQASWFLSRLLFDELGGVNENIHFCMDVDLSFRWTKYSPQYLLEPMPIAVYRVHSETKTKSNLEKSMQERLLLYKTTINKYETDADMRQQLWSSAKKEISGNYLHVSGVPLRLKYIIRSIYLNPARIFAKDFWNLIIFSIRHFFS